MRSEDRKFFLNRIRNVRRMMRAEKLDALLITRLSNVRYLCNFTGSSGCLLIHPDKTIFLSDNRYREQASREVICDEIQILSGVDMTSRIVSYVRALKLKQLGVESRNLTFWQYMCLEEVMDRGCRIIPTEEWIESLRPIKDALELRALRRAARIADRAFKKILGLITEGMTELELSRLLRDALEEYGGRKLSFDPIVLFGGRTSLIHGQPNHVRLKKGQLVLMDFGTVYEGYCSDITRTVAFGEPGEAIRKAYHAVQQAQREARAAVRSGRRTNEVDAAARRRLEALGFGREFSHATGHSLGLEIHEDPRLSDQTSDPLRTNMVVTIEPGVYRPGKYGIRIEDMVRVTSDGSESLTRSSRQLMVL